MTDGIVIGLLALAFVVAAWSLLRKPSEPNNLAATLQALTQAVQSSSKDTAVLAEKVQKIDSDQAKLAAVLQDVQRDVTGTSRDTSGLLETAKELRQNLNDARTGLNTLHTITRERQEDERLMSESVRRLESVIAGTQSKGAAGENILDLVFSRLPADWQVRNFLVEGCTCEFGLRLPNKKIVPIDSKWPATTLLEQFLACEDIGGKKKIKMLIEKAVLKKAEEVQKYLDPDRTIGFGIAVVPDAVYDLCGATLCQVFELKVAVISYSMFIPYLLLVFQTNMRSSSDVDLHKLSHAVSEAEKSIKAIQDEIDGRFSRAVNGLNTSRNEVKKETAKMQHLLSSVHRDEDADDAGTLAAFVVTAG